MATLAQRLWKAANVAAVWMYRRTGGKVGGKAKGGSLVLLLTVAGRKSGQPHTVPVAYVERDGDYYLAATAGGQPKEPQWIRNLRAASSATVEVGRDRKSVSVEVLADLTRMRHGRTSSSRRTRPSRPTRRSPVEGSRWRA